MATLKVKKANYLIPLEERMSKAAQLWVSYLVACLPKADEGISEFPELTFSFQEVKRAINADGKRRITEAAELKQIHKELMGTPLWHEDDKSASMVAWLTEVLWDKKLNKFTYYFHPKLKPFLLNLKEHYTWYHYYYRVCLSPHGMKMYEVLKMYHYLSQVELSIEEDIKAALGLVGKYQDYYNFRRRVLDPIQEEFRKFTDITFTYEPMDKDGKKILTLLFKIEMNRPTHLPKPLLEAMSDVAEATPGSGGREAAQIQELKRKYAAIFEQLSEWGGREEVISSLMHKHGNETVLYQITHLKRLQKEGKQINNPFAWIIKAIEYDYKDVVQEMKTTRESVKKQRYSENAARVSLESELRELRNSYTRAQVDICDELLARDTVAMEEAIGKAKDNLAVRQALEEGKSVKEIFDSPVTRYAVIARVREKSPQAFEKADKYYRKKIADLEKRVNALV